MCRCKRTEIERETHKLNTHRRLFVPYMRASHGSVRFQCAPESARSQLAAPLARRIWHQTSPHLAREEGRASHSEGLHRLTRTLKHTSVGTCLHIKERRGPPALSPTWPYFYLFIFSGGGGVLAALCKLQDLLLLCVALESVWDDTILDQQTSC